MVEQMSFRLEVESRMEISSKRLLLNIHLKMLMREREREHTPSPQLPSNKTQQRMVIFFSFSVVVVREYFRLCRMSCVRWQKYLAYEFPRHSTYKSLSSLENHISTEIIVQRDSIGSIDIPNPFHCRRFFFAFCFVP